MNTRGPKKELVQEIEAKIRDRIADFAMLPSGALVAVGFSGGADSSALLHFLWNNRKRYKIRILAVHVNHLLRGKESFRDEAAAEAFCKEREIPFRAFRGDVKSLAQEQRLSLEECGRNFRYACFREAVSSDVGKAGLVRIATAHTASDQTETVLFHLLKGSGGKGLSGIPSLRGNIIRPLLSVTRKEVEEYCRFYGISYCTDSTNLNPEYDRNRLRLQVLPTLYEMNPALDARIGSCARLLEEDSSFLDKLTEKEYSRLKEREGFRCQEIKKLPVPLFSRLIKRLLEEAGARRLSFLNIKEAMEAVYRGSAATASGGVRMDASGVFLQFFKGEESNSYLPQEWSVRLNGSEVLLPDGRKLFLEPIEYAKQEKNSSKENKINNLLFNNRAFYDKILYTGLVRNRRPGDTYCPAGRKVRKSVKKLFNEEKVPLEERWKRVFLVDSQSGEILWIEGFGPCEGLSSRAENIEEGRAVAITFK